MKLYSSLDELPQIPMAFTIGNFDGVHLGHQTVLNQLRKTGAPTCVLTFIEHPFQLLRPKNVPTIITPFSVKRLFLQTDFCLLLPFTSTFASMTYSELLKRLPISHLVLGKGSLFGRNREGTELNVRAWGQKHNVQIQYVDKYPGVSSTEIRNAIQKGYLSQAEQLLGRPHLLYAPSTRFSASDLTLPPDGSYVLSNGVYQNNMKNLELDTNALAGRQVMSENKNSRQKPTQSKTNPLNCLIATIQNQIIELNIPIEQPTILSFNKEFYV